MPLDKSAGCLVNFSHIGSIHTNERGERAMAKSIYHELSRRERQIMDVICQKGKATANEVFEALPDPPSDTSVRKLIRILEQKGYLTHKLEGKQHVYKPTAAPNKIKRAAVEHLLETFFDGSALKAVATLLNVSRDRLSPDEMKQLSELIEEASRQGR